MGVTLELVLAYRGTLESYLRQFGVEKHEMASVMVICASLVGPKSENVEKLMVFKAFLKVQKSPEYPKCATDPPSRSTFWSLWGRFLVCEGDFGSLWDHFGTIVR